MRRKPLHIEQISRSLVTPNGLVSGGRQWRAPTATPGAGPGHYPEPRTVSLPTRDHDALAADSGRLHHPRVFMYGRGRGHCYSGPVTTAERLKEMAQHIMRHQPAVRDTQWWQY
ncbi:MAG: hypothetical protein JSW71_18490 [Gemmatimonadota bacterium]|nr:MAG: hypothetical protein JSW71_18490 [Gemmatimonadota bacterium]